MMEISKKLNVSHNKIVYWMNQYNIQRRTRSEAVYKKHNPKGNPFRIKQIKNKKDFFIYGMGLGIYWGEGNKADKNSIRIGTSDPQMIIQFRYFLLYVCGVPISKFKYSLMCFKNSNISLAKKYWSKALKIKSKQLGKVTKIPPMGKGRYKKISNYGVCTIYVNNTKLKKWIMDELETLKYNKLLRRFSSVG